ncbi:MAG: hypothetical protein ABFR82_17325 [Nitrospirota bacterium]
MDNNAKPDNIKDSIKSLLILLLDYCRKNDWAGFDPYDALNSRVFAITPFSKSRICRIGFTQIMKRLPFNLRPLILVSKEQNPKAIALFLMAFLKLSKLGLMDNEGMIKLMLERLEALRSQNTPYWCWGYSFPWQTRTHLVPRGAPNLVCTVFVANALLDAYESNLGSRYLTIAENTAEYILNELYWTEDESIAGFSYPFPLSKTKIHNANFLGAALFGRIYKLCGEKKFLEPALKVTRYSASKQHENGSWDYGELPTQHWVDNFHTGYNLCALLSIGQYAGSSEFEPHIRRGFEFYRNNFFREDGAPKYFHNRVYPIDIHSVAQSIITLLALRDFDEGNIELAHSVYNWANEYMWDRQGYFYFQSLPLYRIKISYMRWSQAWMFTALSYLSTKEDK